MKVRTGWSLDYGRKKFDVELEQEDLTSLLAGNGIPAERHGELTLTEKFRVLYLEAQWYSAVTRATEDGGDKDLPGRIAQDKANAFAQVRARLGLGQPQQEPAPQ